MNALLKYKYNATNRIQLIRFIINLFLAWFWLSKYFSEFDLSVINLILITRTLRFIFPDSSKNWHEHKKWNWKWCDAPIIFAIIMAFSFGSRWQLMRDYVKYSIFFCMLHWKRKRNNERGTANKVQNKQINSKKKIVKICIFVHVIWEINISKFAMWQIEIVQDRNCWFWKKILI